MEPLKRVDEFLKNKLRDAKEEKARQEQMGMFTILGSSLIEQVKEAIQSIRVESPSVTVNVPDVIVPKIDTPVIPAFPEIKIPDIHVPAPQVTVNVPEIQLPTINVPEPKVTVNLPEVQAPVVNVAPAEVHFPETMMLTPNTKPFPVIMVDQAGKAMDFSSGGSGPGFPMQVLDDTGTTPAIRVSGSFSISASNSSTQAIDSSGNPYSQANPFPVVFGSSGTTGTNIIDSTGVAYSGSNPLPVTITSGGTATSASNIVDSSGVAYSGSNPVPVTGTVAVSGVTGSIGATILNGEGIARDTWGSSQVGTWNIATLTGITNSTATSIVDSTGVAFEGANPFPISGAVSQSGTWNIGTVSSVTSSIAATLLNGEGLARDTWGASQVGTWNVATLTGITNTIAAANVDSTGVQYSGSNPFPMTGTVVVSSVTASTASSLIDSTGVQYSGSNPVPTKEVRAATGTNTSVADNAASVTILASNTARLGATVYNDSSAILYLLLGSTAASTTNYTCKIASSGYYEVPFGYTGQLTGIWATDPGDGAARVTEIT